MGTAVAGVAQAAAAVAVAVIQAGVAKGVADKQYDIAKKQLAIAQFVQDTWKTNHLPCELKLLAEVCAEPMYVPQYDMVTARAGNDVAIAFSKQRTEIRRKLSVYSVGSFIALERQMGIAEALVTTDAIASARRREDGRAELKKQQRIENQNRAVALGRNLLDQSGSAMRAAAAGYSAGGSTIASAVNSGAQLLGYLSERNFNNRDGKTKLYDTESPERRSGAVSYLPDAPLAHVTGVPPTNITGFALTQPGVANTDALTPPINPSDPNGYGDA